MTLLALDVEELMDVEQEEHEMEKEAGSDLKVATTESEEEMALNYHTDTPIYI